MPDISDAAAVTPPSATAAAAARELLAGLATPAGALGRLGELAVWVSATQGRVPPEPLDDVRAVVFAADHGVAAHGVSAYPASVTAAMVTMVAGGRAGVSALARQHGVPVRVVDAGVGAEASRPLHLEDALDREQVRRLLALGAREAATEIAAGARLLVGGDLGIGNTTPSACVVGLLLGLPAQDVVGRGTGIDDAGLARKTEVVATAMSRAGTGRDPESVLAAVGGGELVALTGFVLEAARRGVPVLLDGVVTAAAALAADRVAPGVRAWCAAGHRSTEPAQRAALAALGLDPLLDVGMRLGEGSGALAALPLLRSATALLRETARLAEVL